MSKLIVSLILILVLSVSNAQTNDYTIPDLPENINPELVVATVGDTPITLGDFIQRVRYERLFYYQALVDLATQGGEEVFNLDDPANPYGSSVRDLLVALGDDHQFPALTYDTMLVEALYSQEAVERGITVDDCTINELWAIRLNVTLDDCENPSDEFLSRQETYYQNALTFAGMEKSAVDQSIVAVAQYQAVYEALREETPITEIPARRTRHIRVGSETLAQEIYERINTGESTFEEELINTLDQGARGNGGALGYIQRGNTVPEFESAAFSGETGLIETPVQSEFGYHIIQVNDIQPAASARQIVVEDQEAVDQILALLQDGATFEDLAARFSIDIATSQRAGDLGTFTHEMLIPELSDPIFAQTEGGLLEPIQTELGIHIIEVTNYIPVALVDVSHILVETEAEATAIIEQLKDGGDFASLAVENSIDPSAAGHRGDTLYVFTGGQQTGLFVFEETNMVIDRLLFGSDAEVGTVLEPFQIGDFWLVMILDEVGERHPTLDNVELSKRYYVRDWETAQNTDGRVKATGLWRRYVPFDILPSEYAAILSPLDAPLLEAREAFLNSDQANTFANILYQLGSFSE